MRKRTWEARREKLLKEESEQPLRWWYLSFAGPKFLGAVIVEARGITTAVDEASRRGINPGGSVLAIPVPEWVVLDEVDLNRLLTREDVHRMGAVKISL